jgi:signal transduction histidine kinase
MKDRRATLVGRALVAPSWFPTLDMRRDVALPLGVLLLQLTAATISVRSGLLHSTHLDAVDWWLLIAGPAALVMRRRHHSAVLWVTCAATLKPATPGFVYPSLIVAFFAATTAGNRYVAWLVMAFRFTWAIWLAPFVYGDKIPPSNDVLLIAGWLLVIVIAAEATRIQSERVLATKAARQIDKRRRESVERLGIARDLHDVIGHNISLISIQASMGLELMDSQPEQARAALGAIKAASREALEELRAVLTTLRRDEEVAPRAPAPGLERLNELVQHSNAAGLSVEVQIFGKAAPLPPTVHLAAYRIIQESLTNVVRHAGQARVTVRVTFGDEELRLEITDDGKASGNGASATGTGSGIAGMRERAAALGGVFHAGFCSDGGFRVSACLPIRSSS